MIQIIPGQSKKETEKVLNRLANLSLAFSLREEDSNGPVTLTDGEVSYTGIAAIEVYLDELQNELHQWHYCSC